MQSSFVHLRLHTEYSLVDSLLRIDAVFDRVPKLEMQAVALTDYCNLFAVVKWYQAALNAGVKPLIGCDLCWFYPGQPNQIYSLILLCQNEIGYLNLTKLVSKAYQDGQFQGQPRVQYDWIVAHSEGLIALSGGKLGDIGCALLAEDEELAITRTLQWASVFEKRFYLEIQRTNRENENLYNKLVVGVADKLQLPLVATNDVRFLTEADYAAHEARVCIHQGRVLADPRRDNIYSPKQYLRSAAEMQELFHDLPQALQNTVEISKRCTLRLKLDQPFLPNFSTPAGQSVDSYLADLATQGLNNRLLKIKCNDPVPYRERLAIELDVIQSMGFAGYFLIVADFIIWAKNNGVPVGPGRGSGAGSLVAYALKITDLDPLEFDLLFERFLNPERVSMPDFDIDFCVDGRDRVIEYVATKYGRQSVSQIITFGTMAAKAVIRDVGRVLAHPYGFVDKLAKLIPFEIGITLQSAMEQEAELRRRYEDEEDVKELIDLALKLEGLTRNAGKHAGGVVIAPSCLTDFTAIYCEQDSTQLVSQLDKDDVERVGLVKFDFLGLRTLTIINWSLLAINAFRRQEQLPPIDIEDIPMDDPKTFALLSISQTTGVFQLESRGMKELINRLQPDCFEDIIALVALFRPGPLQSGMVDDFIDRKHGRANVEYLHPDLAPILQPTYGVILYQEQVMQIAQVLANYTLGGADLLRRAMGKKKAEEMAQQRAIFVDGAVKRGIDSQCATIIFDLMEKFAGYGFNKSHSAAYALIAYQTAWLKASYPAAFMAAVMSSDMDKTDKVVTFIRECEQMKLIVLPPLINRSQRMFSAIDDQQIIYGLGAIKGVGDIAIDCIIAERDLNGPYEGLFDLCQRLDTRKVNRRVLEALIKSGSFDEWGVDRAVLALSLDNALQAGAQFSKNQISGQADLFSLLDETPSCEAYLTCKPWPKSMRLTGEKETLGLYLTGHPVDDYQNELRSMSVPLNAVRPARGKKIMTCGLIRSLRSILTKRNKKLVIMTLEDARSNVDVVIYSEVFELIEDLTTGEVVVVEGEVSYDEYTKGVKITASKLYRITEARTCFSRCLLLTILPEDAPLLPALQGLLSAHQGNCVVQIQYIQAQTTVKVNVARQWCVTPSDDLLLKLSDLIDDQRVELCY